MQKCNYCGRENDDALTACNECGTSLREPPPRFISPKESLYEAMDRIWDYLAVKRGRKYVAGFCLGAVAGLIGTLEHFGAVSVSGVIACGLAGVVVVSIFSLFGRA
jgi:hypothetical protein